MAVHRHTPTVPTGRGQLVIALFLTLAMMVIEVIIGLMSGSLALVADGGHMLADASALSFSLFAAWIASRPASSEKTYGYYRSEILAALANGLMLWVMVVWIVVRAVQRLRHATAVEPGLVLIVAIAGLLVNLLNGWVLFQGAKTNLNVRGAWLNVMSDAVGSVGVIIAALVIRRNGWMAADPIASLVIACLIAASSWTLIKQSIHVLLEGAPQHLRTEDVAAALQRVPGVCEVHDLHLWTITTGLDAMSGHVIIENLGQSPAVLEQLTVVLRERFGITHTTLQLEPRK